MARHAHAPQLDPEGPDFYKKAGRRMSAKDIESIARQAHAGEDVSEHFTGTFVAKQRVNIDFSVSLLRQIDAECGRVGVARQAWIKMVCDERLRCQAATGTPEPTSARRAKRHSTRTA